MSRKQQSSAPGAPPVALQQRATQGRGADQEEHKSNLTSALSLEAGRSAQAYTRSIHEESCRSNLGTHVAPHNHDAAQREEGKDVEADIERQEAQQVVARSEGGVEAGA